MSAEAGLEVSGSRGSVERSSSFGLRGKETLRLNEHCRKPGVVLAWEGGIRLVNFTSAERSVGPSSHVC